MSTPHDAGTALEREIEHLRVRNRKLAEDKSYYILILRLMEQLSPLPVLEDMLRAMLASIVDCIGGTNIRVYYWIEGELHCCGFKENDRSLAAIDHPVVEKVVATREYVEEHGDAEDGLLRDGMLRQTFTWTFPLMVGPDLVGVIRLENLHIHGAALGRYLPTFCRHAALILANGVRNRVHQRAELALEAATDRLRLATEAGLIGIWDWDIARDVLSWDTSMYRLYGRTAETFAGTYAAWLEIVHPEDRAYVDAEARAALRGEREYAPEFRVVWPDGSIRYIKAAAQAIRDADGKPLRGVGINYDLTERKQAEEAQRRLNRELRAISDCNQALMRATDEHALLGDICRIICEEAGYVMAWVGYAEHDAAHTVQPVASAGRDEGYLEHARVSWADDVWGRGPSGSSIRTGESVRIQDFTTDERAAPWRAAALARGYRSCVGLALKDTNARTFGSLVIYSTEPAAFDAAEVRLLEELAADLSFGITVLRGRSELAAAEAENRTHLRFLAGMDRVNRAIQGSQDIEHLLGDVLEATLAIFECDRVGLAYPCDPGAKFWQIMTERAKPGFGTDYHGPIPMSPDRAWSMRMIAASSGPIRFGPGGDHPLTPAATEIFGIRAYMSTAVYPRPGEVWEFALASCAAPREWSTQELMLFKEISRRLGDALSRLLVYRELRENESKLAAAERMAELGYIDRDLVRGTVSLSEETYRICGFPPEPPITALAEWNARWLGIVHPDDRPQVEQRYADALGGVASYDIEYRIVHPDGTFRYVHGRAALTCNDAGQPVRMLGTLQDITARHLAEDRLRAREREFRTLAENSPDVIVRYDRECRRTYVNPEFVRVNGLTPRQVIGKSPEELSTYLAPLASSFTDRLRSVMQRGEPEEIDYDLVRDGEPEYWYIRAVPEFDAQGQVSSVLTIWSNITARKVAEQRVRTLNAELSATLQAIPDLLFDLDGDGRYLSAWAKNPALLAADREALIGHTVQEMLPPPAAATVLGAIREADASGTSYGRIIRLGLDGGERWFELSVSRKADTGEAVGRFIVLSRDITERKLAEAELERHRLHLEELVETRTRELAEARDAAESANRMKSVFLANMSHELRTPLNAILGFAQVMARDPRIPDDQRSNLGAINRGGRHLLTLINDVLEISRIEAGRSTLQPTSFDLHEMLRSLGEFVELRARQKHLGLVTSFAPEVPRFVRTDAGKLRQVLLNLLTNAVKYSEHGEVVLSANARPDGARVVLEFAVRDTGVGLSEPELKAIFQPFYQTEYGAALGEGTGLGLSISREYAQLLGGELTAESTEQQGSTFRLAVPVEAIELASTAAVLRGTVAGLAPGQDEVRVLVVDDDEDSRRLLEALLSRVGMSVRTACDGAAAVDVFTRWRPGFIWMDMRMPVVDGYEATRRIRALPEGGSVRIAALTASAFKEDQEAIRAVGCDDVLAKPLDEAQLFATMERLLGVRYRYEEPPQSAPEREPDLGALSEEQRAELAHAADLLDMEQTERVIGRIAATDVALAERLTALARAYRYDRIVALCESARRST
ncbi:MAG: PAS domain-containing protein [Gammaproteobacteria bacterium]|nr:PAS domain-containing protein [Gammaproteobacteria bacterium]